MKRWENFDGLVFSGVSFDPLKNKDQYIRVDCFFDICPHSRVVDIFRLAGLEQMIEFRHLHDTIVWVAALFQGFGNGWQVHIQGVIVAVDREYRAFQFSQ